MTNCTTCAASIETRAAPCDECGHVDQDDAPATIELEFWLGTATDEDGDLHNSETIWGDGMTAADALELYQGMLLPYPEGYLPEGCDIVVHGPYLTNEAAKA